MIRIFKAMGWADWMTFDPTHEELFEVERSVREVHNCNDEEALKQLCAGLVRQSFHQQKLLAQACTRIGELDAKLACWD